MAVMGRLRGVKFGPDATYPDMFAGNASVNYAMASLNTGWSARFIATTAKDIYSAKVRWNSVATPGTVQVRIETDSSGKPSGSLYDANAVLSFTPSAGVQTLTFASHPTAGLTIGTAYHLVLLTTVGGTTQTLSSALSGVNLLATYPQITLTAADGTTRTNFAEVASSCPIASFLLSDGSEDCMGLQPTATTANAVSLITSGGTVKVAGLKCVTDTTIAVAGFEAVISKSGTPTADLRFRIYDNSNNLVSNSTIIVPVATLTTGASQRQMQAWNFAGGAVISLSAGTYRAVLDGAADTAGANCWNLTAYAPMSSAAAPSGFSFTTAANIASPSWMDTTDQVPLRLILDDITASGAAGMLYIPDLAGT